jgi:hypothetical protein
MCRPAERCPCSPLSWPGAFACCSPARVSGAPCTAWAGAGTGRGWHPPGSRTPKRRQNWPPGPQPSARQPWGIAICSRLYESDLHLLPLIRAMWMKGRRVRVPTPGTNQRHAFFGALDAVTGRWWYADHDRKLAVHFVALLQRLVQAYPTGPLSLVRCPGAGTYRQGGAKLAQSPPARHLAHVAQICRA